MTAMTAIREEAVTATKVWQVKNGSVGGIDYPWMVSINGHTAGEFQVARYQADPMVFRSRKAAREFADRARVIGIFPQVGGAGFYAVMK